MYLGPSDNRTNSVFINHYHKYRMTRKKSWKDFPEDLKTAETSKFPDYLVTKKFNQSSY